MYYINEDSNYKYYVDYFEGLEINMYVDKNTGELFLNRNDVAKVLGYNNFEEMMQNPEIIKVYMKKFNNEQLN